MNDVFEIFAHLAESCVTVWFLIGFLGFHNEKLKLPKAIGIFIILSLNNILLSPLEGYGLISAGLAAVICFIFAEPFLSGKLHEKIIASVIPPTVAYLTKHAVMSVLISLSDDAMSVLGGSLLLAALVLFKAAFYPLCLYAVRKRRDKNSEGSLRPNIHSMFFFISTVITADIGIILREMYIPLLPLLIIYALLNVLDLALFLILRKIKRDSMLREERQAYQINLAAQEQLVVEARERFTEISTLRHDMKHCLTAAAELIDSGDSEGAKRYLESVLKEKIDGAAAAITTGCTVIDAVLNSKLSVCAKKGISTKFQVDIALGKISETDMSILLSNLLDNAIRGCEGAKKPTVEITIKRKKSFLCITVKNTVGAPVLTENPRLETSKADKSGHGFGIRSIRELAKKYGGTAEFSENNGEFIAEIWLKSEE